METCIEALSDGPDLTESDPSCPPTLDETVSINGWLTSESVLSRNRMPPLLAPKPGAEVLEVIGDDVEAVVVGPVDRKAEEVDWIADDDILPMPNFIIN